MIELLTCAEAELPADLKRQALALMRAEWPEAFAGEKAGRERLHDPGLRPTCMLLAEGGAVVSYAGVLRKRLGHAGEAYEAYGLSGVVTAPAFRARGHGRALVATATALMAAEGADVGLFTCAPRLRGFYEGAGWEVMDGTPLIGGTRARPFPSDGLGLLTLMRFFSDKAKAHRAAFAGAPIYLELAEGDLW